jgi:hypothetical protein
MLIYKVPFDSVPGLDPCERGFESGTVKKREIRTPEA